MFWSQTCSTGRQSIKFHWTLTTTMSLLPLKPRTKFLDVESCCQTPLEWSRPIRPGNVRTITLIDGCSQNLTTTVGQLQLWSRWTGMDGRHIQMCPRSTRMLGGSGRPIRTPMQRHIVAWNIVSILITLFSIQIFELFVIHKNLKSSNRKKWNFKPYRLDYSLDFVRRPFATPY